MTSSIAEEARNATSVDDNRTYTDRESKKDKYNDSIATAEDRVGVIQPLYNRSRQGKELLCLWRIWAHSLTLQK